MDQLTYQPEYEFELILDEKEDYEDLIQAGRYGDITNLRQNRLHILHIRDTDNLAT